jgi:hypothetical protein
MEACSSNKEITTSKFGKKGVPKFTYYLCIETIKGDKAFSTNFCLLSKPPKSMLGTPKKEKITNPRSGSNTPTKTPPPVVTGQKTPEKKVIVESIMDKIDEEDDLDIDGLMIDMNLDEPYEPNEVGLDEVDQYFVDHFFHSLSIKHI